MYGSNFTTPSRRMLSYNSALLMYDSIKPIRGRQDQNTRPLAGRSGDKLTIRQDYATKDIIVRLYATDIIRYEYCPEEDNDQSPIHLCPYGSVLTNRIVWSLLGPHVSTHWGGHSITEAGGRYYNTPQFATIQCKSGNWTLTAGSKPLEVPYINRKLARQALKDNHYDTFKLWMMTKIRLGLGEFGRRYGRVYEWTPQTAVNYLRQGETGWAEIMGRMSSNVTIEAELRSLRDAVYRHEMCFDIEVVDYFTGYAEFKQALKRVKKFS